MVSSMSFLKYSLWPSVLTPSGRGRPSASSVLGSSFTSSVEAPSRLALRRRSNKSEIVATKVRAPAASPAVLPKVVRPNLVLRRPELSRAFPRPLRSSSTASLRLGLLRANNPHILLSTSFTSFTSFDTLYSLDDHRPGVVTPAASPGEAAAVRAQQYPKPVRASSLQSSTGGADGPGQVGTVCAQEPAPGAEHAGVHRATRRPNGGVSSSGAPARLRSSSPRPSRLHDETPRACLGYGGVREPPMWAPFDTNANARACQIAIADASKALRWDARGFINKNVLEYYVLHRRLRLERFKVEAAEFVREWALYTVTARDT